MKNVKSQSDVQLLAKDVYACLEQYIVIHNKLFKISWKRFIPLPFAFRDLNYNILLSEIIEIQDYIENLYFEINEAIEGVSDEEKDFANCLSGFCYALGFTVSLLKDILYGLSLNTDKPNSYSFSDYKAMVNIYNESVEDYTQLGAKLNELYKITYVK